MSEKHTSLHDEGRPEPEDFGSATIRLLEAGVITGGTAYNMSRASDVTRGEAIRVLTDLAINRQEWADKLAEQLAAEEISADKLAEKLAEEAGETSEHWKEVVSQQIEE